MYYGMAGALGTTVLLVAIALSRTSPPTEGMTAPPPAETEEAPAPSPVATRTVKRERLRISASARVESATAVEDPGEEEEENVPEEAEAPQAQMAPDDVGLPPKDRIMVGDAHFEAGDLEAAWPYYLSVVEEQPEDPLAAFALYKMAWIQWNTGKPDDAIADLKLARDWFAENGDQQSPFFVKMIEKELAQLQAEHPSLQATPPPE